MNDWDLLKVPVGPNDVVSMNDRDLLKVPVGPKDAVSMNDRDLLKVPVGPNNAVLTNDRAPLNCDDGTRARLRAITRVLTEKMVAIRVVRDGRLLKANAHDLGMADVRQNRGLTIALGGPRLVERTVSACVEAGTRLVEGDGAKDRDKIWDIENHEDAANLEDTLKASVGQVVW
jgi:hypothetical protein